MTGRGPADDRQAEARAPLVACVNSNEDVVQLLADSLRLDSFRAVSHATPIRQGADPVIQFVRDLRPDACIYNVSLPYAESWRHFEALRAAVPDVAFVLTTVNARGLEAAVGPTESIEILGKPLDLEQLCAAVRRALDSRDVRGR